MLTYVRMGICLLALCAGSAHAVDCIDSIKIKESETSKTTMVAGTVVGIAAGQLASPDPRITFVSGEIGCEYGEAFAKAWRENKAALVIYGSLYVFAEMPISKDTGQYFIQFMGDVGERAREEAPEDKIKPSDIAITPTLVTANEAAKIAEKNGIDGDHVATAILLINPTQAFIEVLAGGEIKKVPDKAGREIKRACNKWIKGCIK